MTLVRHHGVWSDITRWQWGPMGKKTITKQKEHNGESWEKTAKPHLGLFWFWLHLGQKQMHCHGHRWDLRLIAYGDKNPTNQKVHLRSTHKNVHGEHLDKQVSLQPSPKSERKSHLGKETAVTVIIYQPATHTTQIEVCSVKTACKIRT